MIRPQPLTEEEQDLRNRTSTPRAEQMRLYAKDLRFHADVYAIAADAPGLRKDAAKYLYAEAERLTRQSNSAYDRAEEL